MTTTTAAPAPPSLAVTPARVDLGAAGATATLTVRNGGDEPLSWTADPSTAWLRVSPSSGRLDGGEQARVTLSATRDGLPEGDADGRVELTWGGPARSVVVALRVERAPEIGGLSASPRQIFTGPCGADHRAGRGDGDRRVGHLLGDHAVGRRVGPHDPARREVVRQPRPRDRPGLRPLEVVATDARGNTASASGPAVTASPCRP